MDYPFAEELENNNEVLLCIQLKENDATRELYITKSDE